MPDNLRDLVSALDTDNTREQRRVGNLILAHPSDTSDALAKALRHGPPNTRKASAYLLGRLKASHETVEALADAATSDPEPKVRKNSAVSLGKIGAVEGVEALASALQRETVPWVRISIVLALGAIGGHKACEALLTATPRDEAEHEALRKALDRTAPRSHTASWRDGYTWPFETLLEVPAGLEQVALAEAVEKHITGLRKLAEGWLLAMPSHPPSKLIPPLRCAAAAYVRGGYIPAVATIKDLLSESGHASLGGALSASEPLREWRNWISTHDGELRYRFSVRGERIRRDALRALLHVVREACLPLGLVDSPSNYDIEITVDLTGDAAELLIKPSFLPDARFKYRAKDVGAALDPVIAACLARLVRTGASASCLDPTCGSGTILIERAILDNGILLTGIDISPTAIDAAETNILAAGLQGRIRAIRGDATNSDLWPDVDEIVANLPFGLRTGHEQLNLDKLYKAIVTGIARHLRPGGRAILYCANERLLGQCLRRHTKRIRVRERLWVRAGGLRVGVWVIEPALHYKQR